MEKYIRTILFIGMVFLVPSFASAAVIFSDNYDNPGDTGWNCSLGLRTGYTGQSYCPSATSVDGITHYSGEISTGGRTGNSLKLWRRNGWATDYQGYLNKSLTSSEFNSHYKEIYVRWYVKTSPNWDANLGDSQTHKLNRINVGSFAGSDKEGEVYFDVKGETFKTGRLTLWHTNGADKNRTWMAYTSDGGNPLSINQMGLNDGNWHSLELRYKIGDTDGGFQLWYDGTALNMCEWGSYCGTNHTNLDTQNSTSEYIVNLLPPAIGNLSEGTWAFPTSGWYAFEFDDYVVSTS